MSEFRLLSRFLWRSIAPGSTVEARVLRQRGRLFPPLPDMICGILIATILGGALFGFWLTNLNRLFETAPVSTSLKELRIKLAPGQSVSIGRNELAQRGGISAAELEHVLFQRDQAGNWSLRNIARQRRVSLSYQRSGETFAARWQITPGDQLRSGAITARFDAVDGARLRFTITSPEGARTFEIDDGPMTASRMTVDGQLVRDCEPMSFFDKGARFLTKAFAPLKKASDADELALVAIGGKLDCRVGTLYHVSAPGVPWQGLRIFRKGSVFLAGRGRTPGNRQVNAEFSGGPGAQKSIVSGFSGISWPVGVGSADVAAGSDRIRSMVIGRTSYALDTDPAAPDVITLRPFKKVHWFNLSDTGIEPQPADANQPDCITTLQGVPDHQEDKTQVVRCLQPAYYVGSGADSSDILRGLSTEEKALRQLLVLAPLGLLSLMTLSRIWNVMRRRQEGSGLAHQSWRPLLFSLAVVGSVTGIVLQPEFHTYILRLDNPVGLRSGLTGTLTAFAIVSTVIALSSGRYILDSLLWFTIMLLVALGSLVLLSLAIDGLTSHWLIYIQKHKLLFLDELAVAAALVATVPLVSIKWFLRMLLINNSRAGLLFRGIPAALLIFALGAWFVFGDEEGVSGFQPVELGKIAIVIIVGLLAIGLARSTDPIRTSTYRRWATFAVASILVFGFGLVGVPFFKSDYSPLLIIVLVVVALTFLYLLPWAWRFMSRLMRRKLMQYDAPVRFQLPVKGGLQGWQFAALFVTGAVIVVAGSVFLESIVSKVLVGNWSLPQQREVLFAQLDKARTGGLRVPAERILTWYDLDHKRALELPADGDGDQQLKVRYRDLGLQLFRSKRALYFTPCGFRRLDWRPLGINDQVTRLLPDARTGSCESQALSAGAVRLAGLDAENGTAAPGETAQFTVDDLVRIPVIQNDFIGTYLTVRFGYGAMVLVLAAQSLFLIGCLLLARRLRPTKSVGFGDAERAIRQFLSVLAGGVAVLFMLHWVIAWSNILGLLPVMGQPMSFLAAATSHHLFMVAPAVLITVIAGRYARFSPKAANRLPPDW